MESDGDRHSSGGSCNPHVVCEKHLFKSKLSESLFQLACTQHHCAFPLNQNELCIWNTVTAQPLHLSGHHYSISALSFGSKIKPLLVCSASCERVIVWNLDECTHKVQEGLTPQGIVVGTLLGMVRHVRFSPDDQQVAICAGNQIYMLSAKKEAILAELDGHLAPVTAAEFCAWEKSMLISVSEDRTFKVWDYSTGKLMYQSGVLTAFPLLSLLIDEENKQIITGCTEGQLWIFSLISDHNYRCIAHVNLKKEQNKFCNKVWKTGKETGKRQNTSKLCKTSNVRPEGSVEASLPVLSIERCDFLVCFHNEENIQSYVKETDISKDDGFTPSNGTGWLGKGEPASLYLLEKTCSGRCLLCSNMHSCKKYPTQHAHFETVKEEHERKRKNRLYNKALSVYYNIISSSASWEKLGLADGTTAVMFILIK